MVWEAPLIDEYEENFQGEVAGFWVEMGQLIGSRELSKSSQKNDA